jgi:cupin fold WbuC family metalloprotein
MKSIYSKLDSTLICNYIHKDDITEYRTDLSPENEILQGCARILKQDIFIPPHKHKPLERATIGTQESWIILDGKVLAKIYDLDNTILTEIELTSGSCIIFFNGGHALTVLENNTLFYEFKNGPYYGYDTDKYNI